MKIVTRPKTILIMLLSLSLAGRSWGSVELAVVGSALARGDMTVFALARPDSRVGALPAF